MTGIAFNDAAGSNVGNLELAEMLRERLTKKWLWSLPEGCFIISNCGHPNGSPIFAEQLMPLAEREEQWGRIKGKHLDGTLFEVYDNARAFENYMARWK